MFDYLKMFLKGVIVVAGTYFPAELVLANLPNSAEDWHARGAAIALALACGFGKALWNAWKNRGLPGSPFWAMRRVQFFVALVGCGLTLGGCVSMAPALQGKTHYSMDFVDTITPADGEAGQNTEFHVKVAAPAGVDITNLASMDYKWQPDNSGSVKVAGDTKADTTAQAAALVEVNAAQTQAFTSLIQALASALPVLLPQAGGSPDVGQPETSAGFPSVLPSDLAGWIALAREHPEILQLLGGLKP